MNQTERVKMTEAYPLWIGPPPPRFQRERKGKGAGRLYMEQKTLRQWTTERGLTVEAIAQELEVAESTVRGWLNGQRRPHYPRMVQLSEMLGVRVDDVKWEREAAPEVPPMPRSPEFSPTVIATLVSREQYEIAQQWLAAGKSKSEIARAMGVSRETYYKAEARYSSGLTDEEYEAQLREKQLASAAQARAAKQRKTKTQAVKATKKPSKDGAGTKSPTTRRKAVKAVQ